MLNKGFIGPIGDDLPSLIPLLVGLVMFFSTFTLTFNSFDDRNQEFDNDVAVMRISRTIQANSYIFSHDNFLENCNQIGTVNLNYVAGLSEQGVKREEIDSIFDVQFFSNDDGPFYCISQNLNTSEPEPGVSDFLSITQAVDYQVVSRVFPIVLEDNGVVKPMHLFVVAWK